MESRSPSLAQLNQVLLCGNQRTPQLRVLDLLFNTCNLGSSGVFECSFGNQTSQKGTIMLQTTVGIIGIQGKYGQWLKTKMEKLGHDVIGSDLLTDLSNRQVVEQAQVVVFSVPPRVTCDVIREVAPFSNESQLWLDITSLKTGPMEAMLTSSANIIGLHPMCAPTDANWKGQTVVFCERNERCTSNWKQWTTNLLLELEAQIKFASPEDHDVAVAFVQVLPHFNTLVTAAVLRKLNAEVADTLQYTSPFYRIVFSLMGRILAQNPDLYFDIQTLNPYTLQVLNVLEDEARDLREIIRTGDREKFMAKFQSSKRHFGEKAIKSGFDLFEVLNQTLVDWTPEYTLVLNSIQDRIGVLARCLVILAKYGINLTALRTEKRKKPGHCRFVIGIDKKTDNPFVREAVDRITEEIPTVSI